MTRLKALLIVASVHLVGCSSSSDGPNDLAMADAAMAGPCTNASTPDVLTTGQTNASSLRVDATHVYWSIPPSTTGAADGALRRIPLAGGCPENVVSGLGNVAFHIVDGNAYLHDGASLQKVPVTGGAPTVLYADAGKSEPYEIASDAQALYFASPMVGELRRAALDGSGIQVLATGLASPLGLAVDDSSVYLANDGDAGASPPYGNGSFVRVPKQPGGAVESLVTVTGGQDVAVADGHVYFLQFGFPPSHMPGAIWKLDLPGSMPTKIADNLGPGTQIETDGAAAFVSGYVEAMQQGLYRVLPDGSHTKLAAAATGQLALPFALGSSFLVYVAGGEVRKLAKP